MNKEEKLKKYEEWVFKQSAYNMALAIIGIDKMTVAPRAGAEFRDKRSAFLGGELFSIATDPEIYEILKELKDDETLDFEVRRGIEKYYEEVNKVIHIPKEEIVEFKEYCDKSYDAWLEAKNKDDYSIFEPYLKKMIELQKKRYGYRDSDMSIYNQMLNDFEPGTSEEYYDEFFEAIKERIVPLIKKVSEAKEIDDSFLFVNYDIEAQKKFMNELLEYLHFDKEWGYQNESEHPFTWWTCENDCRTTTKYIEDNLLSGITSTVHEVGHAYYEHNINPKYDGMILSEGVPSGMHESQSRLMENYLSKTKAFWEANYPRLQKYFPEQLGDKSLDDFVKAINVSRVSLVRTEADELTYPLHVLIRYEIEKGLFNGTISTEGLNETWKEMYKKYLGIEVPNDRDGILQDVHWSDGSFGYFPTYALGSAMAAQFMNKMREDIDVDDLLRNNKFEVIVEWLKENIHKYGALYDGNEIMKMATGKKLDVNEYIEYLEDKYKELYNLD